MSVLAIFLIGFFITSLVFAACGLLMWAAVEDGRSDREQDGLGKAGIDPAREHETTGLVDVAAVRPRVQ